jgi:diguanylate cyclase (GGDEF)-like protein
MTQPSPPARGWKTPALVYGPIVVAVAAVAASYAGFPAAGGFDVAWTAAATSALAGAALATRTARAVNRQRWRLWTVAAGCWLFGQLAWDAFGVTGFPVSPNVADVAWWGFAALVMVSMMRLPRGSRSVRVVAAVESVQLIGAALALCFGEQWSYLASSPLALAPKLSALAYPAFYVAATMLTLQAMLGGTLRAMRTVSLRLALAGIAAQALAFILWSDKLLTRSYEPGHSVLDPLWVAGLAALGVGGLLAARTPEPDDTVDEPTYLGSILPAAMFGVLLVALVVSRLTHGPSGGQTIFRFGLLCCGVALITRYALMAGRTRTMLARERAALASLAEREAELARLNQQLVEDSRRDPLTGIGNRRALADDLPMLEAVHRERGETFAIALCDVDHFKSYNDRLGHLAGDEALRLIAATARGALRGGDAAYRFGGEELLLVLRTVTPADAMAVGERVRLAVQRAAVSHPDGEGGVLTVSIGVACGGEAPRELLARADSALYEAKRRGRNRVVAADDTTMEAAAREFGRQAKSRNAAESHAHDEPVPRHLRSMLAVSRAVARGGGPMPVLEALAETIRSELSFQVVAVNLLDRERDVLDVVLVLGDEDARTTLLGSSASLAHWHKLLSLGEEVYGAAWLRAGSYEIAFGADAPVWTPRTAASLAPDAWDPEDMLLLPLRSAPGELIGVVSVDEPALGRRPAEADIGVLMAVVDHAGLALDQIERGGGLAAERSDELRLAAVLLLAETLDLRDPSTAHHSRTVGQLAKATAGVLGLSDQRVERIHAAGVLHDLGKLGISDAILHKPGPLDEAEWREMKRHPEVGARILEHAGLRDIAGWVRAHHERVDGRGYPDALSGAELSLEARILAVADAYEAMSADRPYRPGMPAEAARAELMRCAGTQFDPYVVEAFLRALASSGSGADAAALVSAA